MCAVRLRELTNAPRDLTACKHATAATRRWRHKSHTPLLSFPPQDDEKICVQFQVCRHDEEFIHARQLPRTSGHQERGFVDDGEHDTRQTPTCKQGDRR